MTTNKAREKILEFMCKLGQRYLKDGNDDEAFRWLKAAADLGNNDACLSLFKMYRNGESKFKPDIKKAIDYLAEIALDGWYVTTAQDFYAEGWINPRSDFSYCGDDKARFELGCMYLYGDYVERDIFKAACWFANMNDYNAGWLVDTNSYADDTEKFYDALFDLAECYRTGDGIKKDMDMAVAWYEQILNYFDCHDKALFTLAEIYFNGDGVENNIDKAVELYERAADNDNLKAAYKLAKIYRDGIGVDKELEAAQKFFDKTINGLLENFGA